MIIFSWFIVVSWKEINLKRLDEVYAKIMGKKYSTKAKRFAVYFTFHKLRYSSTYKIDWKNRLNLCKLFTLTFLLSDQKQTNKNSKMAYGISKCMSERNQEAFDKICSVNLIEAHFEMCWSSCVLNF